MKKEVMTTDMVSLTSFFSETEMEGIEVLSDGSVTQRYERAFGPKEDRRKSYAEDITVDAKKNNSNNVTVRVTAVDSAGNVSGMAAAPTWALYSTGRKGYFRWIMWNGKLPWK